MKDRYDVVIIGSGLGGLASAIILAKEGYSVCVLEKNNQYGGNLQTFVRDKTIFDTGVHYVGGLSKGQNLYQYFKYLEIIDDLELQKLDEDGFDLITFDNDDKVYKHAQGYENFIATLVEEFPEEKAAIRKYCEDVQDMCNNFPLYEVKLGKPYHEDQSIFQIKAREYINSLTKNTKLQAVLGGTNLLYAGDMDRTPFYVHALSINSYIESSYRCKNGGSQITKVLIKRLKAYGGEVYNHQEVVRFDVENKKVVTAIMKNGLKVKGDMFISNVEPKLTLDMVGADHFRKSYITRVKSIESTVAAFSLYIVLKPGTFKYQNRNFYHFKDESGIWNAHNYTEKTWPETYMISMGIKKDTDQWGDNLTAMTYMRYDEVEQWEGTHNTVANKNNRGQNYEEFKTYKAEVFLKEIEKKFPEIRDCIEAVYTSTPLSYRDYIGSNRGSMYGYVKDANYPLKSFLSPRTKLPNLFFTGQSLNMHGLLGVTISAVLTCSEIIGREHLLEKIWEANKQQLTNK